MFNIRRGRVTRARNRKGKKMPRIMRHKEKTFGRCIFSLLFFFRTSGRRLYIAVDFSSFIYTRGRDK